MSQLREGDLYLYQTPDGGEISVKNGEPVMDGGFQTAMYLSLFGNTTGREWWGNEYLTESEKLKGEFYSFINGSPKSVANILQAEELAKKDLNWFLTEKIADEINVNITSEDQDRISLSVEILANGVIIDKNIFKINWGLEKESPADLRV